MVGYFSQESGTASDCVDAWMTYIANQTTGTNSGIPSGSTITCGPDVTIIDPTTGQPISVETATARTVTGTSVSDFLPPATQGLMRWHTNNYLNGREVRGRTNQPCIPESDSTGQGVPTSNLLSALNARAAALIADADTVFVIWSKKNGQWFAVESGSAWTQFAVLRSRRD